MVSSTSTQKSVEKSSTSKGAVGSLTSAKSIRVGALTSVRIAGVEMLNKRIVIALTYIHGIGLTTSQHICNFLGIDENIRVPDITDEQLAALRDYITKNYVVEGDLRREVLDSIKSLISKGTYRGARHRRGLPVHGQNTKNNAHTRKRRGRKN